MANKYKTKILCIMTVLAAVITLVSCNNKNTHTREVTSANEQTLNDSLNFAITHHYSNNYNFIVKKDSITLLLQQPEEWLNNMYTDSVIIYKHEHLVVADIRILPADPVDSVWVQVANDRSIFGWIHESDLLGSVVPRDPISQFISTFSDTHLLIFLIIISAIAITYLMRTLFRRKAKIVHFNDIPSFYPTLLALIVATSATLYASIQTFAPDTWRHFYYHPTLNPLNVPFILSVFLFSVWLMLITGIAVIDILRQNLPIGEGILYACGLLSVCAINYIVFSITTLYYIGYPLYCAYVYFAINTYLKKARCTYICGYCGQPMKEKGRCPNCDRINT
ncbi:MAG: zinc ribbon domain-containing protein [Prevotella sp.]